MRETKIWLLAGALAILAAGRGGGVEAETSAPPETKQWTGIRVFETGETPEQKAADRRLLERLKARLEADRWVPSYQVKLAVHQGVVTLSGIVDTLLTKERAAQVARTVGGVRGIENQLLISLPALPDYLLAGEVGAILAYNPLFKSSGVQADAQDGFVTISGVVDSGYRKEFAGLLAKSLAGVRGVENKFRVEYVTQRPDQEIQADVVSRIEWDPALSGPQVTVQVLDGRVVLSGWVRDAKARERVIKDGWVAGVKAVDAEGVKLIPASAQ